jgi:hypothetical protein
LILDISPLWYAEGKEAGVWADKKPQNKTDDIVIKYFI